MNKTQLPILSILILFVFSASCSRSPDSTKHDTSLVNDGKVWAALYQQRAAEYRALCFQAYNMARLRLDATIKRHSKKPYVVVTDIDETLLDNSPYDAERALNNLEFDSKTWKQWTAKAKCDTVPGAPSFFKYAASKGVEVFYITNRDEDERPGTVKNLLLYNLPDVDSVHLIFKSKASSKETRRQQVLQKHNVVLFCGDNLPDFDALYDNHPSEASRQATTEQLKKQFGSRYIIIPNPSYGDFESALFNFNYKLDATQKDSIIRSVIKLDK
jgi:5'-nucleotidase (lipoprotein e(P4) family)